MYSLVAFANLLSQLALRSFTPIKISQSERNCPYAEWIRIGHEETRRSDVRFAPSTVVLMPEQNFSFVC